ncbi:hypothetical protein CALCODRAFT_488813 [Calocera cornea HHB12733]|uniref:DUF6535 domain-containing protein n=1 Tax=Calocera cornea HHB12733 TaxID=1353952 RepID=A0A165C697_9BASI|nr:hypothetical protein CALCODRAFT_488813 [Calocera cornea HHB12733]
MEALSDVVDELRKVRKSLDDLQQKAASARSSYIEEATGHDSDPLSPHIATIPGPLEPQVDVHGVDQDWLNPEPDKSENAEIWRTYVEEGDKYDAQLLAKWNEGIDVFLLFTGLFSAILSAFLVAAWPTIQPDPAQGQTDALVIISQQLVLLSLGKPMDPSEVYQAPNFQAPVWAVMVNCLWFTSLFISLLTAVLAMLLKEWLSAYKEGIALVTLERAKQRQMRYDGMINWKVPSIVSMLPLAIHVAVFLFLTGLVLLAWPASTASVPSEESYDYDVREFESTT